ncbi:glucose-6-phosphate 1-epimerase [Mangrovibacterium marinum]|uniref:Putative glucose-6-phosphate 1-epimerase n=1 Tax=Mangrovibacterium marinum TaxID=1639118 RepID=A0A2T5BYC3_9BACT|nr:D-hexose-6-phosphate mutarotase [Mangrovibacterium marinum]PTN07235.1 glucose-6-phosphate 1-epimerase [Mangrovibacterium marinum]
MIDTEHLNDTFGIEGELGFMEMEGDLVFVNIANKYADADICLYGAHVSSFRPVRTMDILWMSPASEYREGTPIRGGIPVCFPWFGPHKTNSSLPQHGFGRLMYWDVLATESLPNGETKLELILKSSEKTKAYWPHDFEAVMRFVVGAKLQVSLEVKNTGTEAFTYGCALHSYFAISDIAHIQIEGLQGLDYFDQLTGNTTKQQEELLQINEALTRHYQNTETPVVLADEGFRRRIRIEKAGSKVTTVWNPGEDSSKLIGDMPDDGFATFVCIEATNSFDFQIKLAAGESYETKLLIGLED